MDDRNAGSVAGVTDEQLARELADRLYKTEWPQWGALLLPLVQDAQRYRQAKQLVDEQAEDSGLWFIADGAAEAYLQQELRRLHAVIEDAAIDKARLTSPPPSQAAIPTTGD